MTMARKILIIDDDTSLRRVLEYNLQEEGYDVIAAGDGKEGLLLFDEQPPDLVITDLKMPGVSGFQVLEAIKKRSPQVPVMVLTAFGAVETAVEAMKLGAYDYITKPFNRDELRLVVRKALEMQGLTEENRRLKEELSERTEFRNIIGISGAMEKVFAVVRKVADTEATVLITGESGTGKELVAKAIHSLSTRRTAPFIAINCAAIPRDLLESELFGHVKGAFTGAVRDKTGKFQAGRRGDAVSRRGGRTPAGTPAEAVAGPAGKGNRAGRRRGPQKARCPGRSGNQRRSGRGPRGGKFPGRPLLPACGDPGSSPPAPGEGGGCSSASEAFCGATWGPGGHL